MTPEAAAPVMSIRRSVVLLGSLSAFGPLSMDLYLPSLPQLQTDLGTSTTLAQLTMSACMMGLGLGQFVMGPLSDRFGRRVPLIAGVFVYTLMSLACAFAPNIGLLIVFRFVQGLGGAAGMVVSRASIRDMYAGSDLARMFSLVMLVSGSAPILAPIIGGQLTRFMDWRGVFLVLAGIGVVLVVGAATGVRESLPREARRVGGLSAVGRDFSIVARDRLVLGVILILACTTASFTTYLSMTSFIFQNEFAVSPLAFSGLYAINSFAYVLGSQVNGRLARRRSALWLLTLALGGGLVGAVLVLVAGLIPLPLVALCASLAIVTFFQGATNPNTAAIALRDHAARAGTAAALLGTAQFVVAPIIGPLVSLAGATAVTLGVTMVVALVLANVVLRVTVRPRLV
ncbi:multidrug effflux MFS transporter [Subtercola sp. YIM 133946]|uniref:multidrug effflux MFS transporter n=1 Tax=Subtercola sp. YIM 133946 TaxID=3118909 RepID=UPI002F928E36